VSISVLQSRRLAAVQTPVIPIISRWTAESPGTISLGQGIVAYGPPPEAVEAVRRFGGTPEDHRYGPVEGQPSLVEALEDKLAHENGIHVRPDSRLVVTAGGNLAFMNAALAITDPGDEVIFPAPFYFNHEMAVTMAGARAVAVATTRDYQLDLDAIARAINERTRAVVTVSPNNPTGAVYSEDALRAVNALCRERGVCHVHDETYEYFTYDNVPHFSPGSIDGSAAHTISLFSMSKAYGMASWRIGYMVIPAALWDAVNKIQDTLLICAPVVSQVAAVAALHVGRRYAASKIALLDRMRQALGRTLDDPSVPCTVAPAPGAFYFFVRVFAPYRSLALTERLIREHQVAVVPGSAFGGDECSIRVSYGALDPASADEGARRLARGLQELART
jgi:aspartate/methionine/tyrosine aminotransferase